jgi:hypothetical protein
MSENNYSHILNIKVWSKNTESFTDYANCLNIIKELFLKKKQCYKGFEFEWKRQKWGKIEKAFELGDLVIDLPFISDNILLQTVRKTIDELNVELQELGNVILPTDMIIFNLVKPLVDLNLNEEIVNILFTSLKI